jgi:hypothetical protein
MGKFKRVRKQIQDLDMGEVFWDDREDRCVRREGAIRNLDECTSMDYSLDKWVTVIEEE